VEVHTVEKFNYKKSADTLALSASMTDFTYKKHCHEEYALGVTLRGIQQYNLDGSLQSSHKNGVMLFNESKRMTAVHLIKLALIM
jgi:hypothetical protein